MNDFFVLAMMKNEEDTLEEWIEHYKLFGATKIFIIDDNSADNSVGVCEKYGDFIEITVTNDLPETYGRQVIAYEKYFSKLLRYNNFALICDIDEFAFALKHNSLLDYCEEHKETSQFVLSVLNFGSNGNIRQPKSLIQSCTKRGPHELNMPGKPIVKLNKIKWFYLHECGVEGPTIKPNLEEIRINHYVHQSKKHILKRLLRGGGNRGPWRSKLSLVEAKKITNDYFYNGHHEQIYDDELIKKYTNLDQNVNIKRHVIKEL